LNLLKIFGKGRTERLIWECENSGVTVQVWEKQDRRELRFGNHIMQSVISRAHPDKLVLPYTRFMLLSLLFCPIPKSVLHIGLGGGCVARWLHKEFPKIQQTAIEMNSAVIDAAHRFFELPLDKRLNVLQADATNVIPNMTEKFELIFLDAFSDFGPPEGVLNIEFLQNLGGCLDSGGWLVGNVWTITKDFLEQCEHWKSIFPQVLQARANNKGNVILFASQTSEFPDLEKFEGISKLLRKHHRIDFFKMFSELKPVL